MAKKIIDTLKSDVKALSFQAGYNALVGAIQKMVPDKTIADDKLEGIIAAVIYYYFAKNSKKYGQEVSMAVRLEAMGDIIQVFGDKIPFLNKFTPYIEGDEEDEMNYLEGFEDDEINYIEAMRDEDEFVDVEGYNPDTDTMEIEGKSEVNIVESF